MNSDQKPSDLTKKLAERLDIDLVLQAAGLGVWEIDPVTNQVRWDQQCRALFGIDREDKMPFQEAMEYVHPDDLTRVLSALQWAMTPQSDGIFDETYRTIGADGGKLRWVRFWGKAHFSPTGEMSRFAGIAQEVTQQVTAKNKIDSSNKMLLEMILQAPIGICVLNASDLVAENVNDEFVKLAGKPYEAIMGKYYWNAFAEVAPYYEAALDQVVQSGEVFSANEIPLMMMRHGKEESTFFTFVFVPLKDATDTVRKVVVWSLENTYQVNERQKVETLIKQRTGELATANEELAAMNEELTSSNEELVVSNQETEAVNAQLSQSNYDLSRSNDNLEKFAYIASHDLQEPLRKIQQFSDILKMQYANQLGEGTMYLDRMQSAAARMSTLIRDLLTYSRITTRQNTATWVPLDKVVDTIMVDLELRIRETGAVVEVDSLPVIVGDRSQLEQLFQNLLSNALKFHRAGASPVVHIGYQRVLYNQLPASVSPTQTAIYYHQIDVTDNGVGFDEKYLYRIFEVFQRLHGRNEFAGTGIGLAICEKVAINHGGAITASSQPGQGATFQVYFPDIPRKLTQTEENLTSQTLSS